jgi:ABC-2 type transport system permease protein
MIALRQNFGAALAETRLRLYTLSRYPAQVAMEIVIPILYAAMPILLGRASAGPAAATNFLGNAGTAQYAAYLLIGSNVYIIVNRAFWDLAYWLRHEQETGTLEAVYLTPTSSLTLAAGVALYSAARSLVTSSLAYVIGCLLFRVNPFQGNLLLALAFILVGLVPVSAMAFLFTAVILRVKEANALVNVMQWGVSFFMGVFFPIAALPPILRFLCWLFPATWMVNGARAAILDLGFFFRTWYGDLAVLWGFLLFLPLFSTWVFQRVENNLRRNRGLGEF